jgi:hypothetical protein
MADPTRLNTIHPPKIHTSRLGSLTPPAQVESLGPRFGHSPNRQDGANGELRRIVMSDIRWGHGRQ